MALVQSEKLAAFAGSWVPVFAHEVKNPLLQYSVTHSYVVGSSNRTARSERTSTSLKRKRVAARRSFRILLKFARQEKSVTRSTDINEVVEAALTIVDHQLTINDVTMTKELDPDLPQIEASANQLQQVVMNFAINAQQAIGPRRVATWWCGRARATIDDYHRSRRRWSGYSRGDSGQHLRAVFTTKRAGEGTGLGLSVTYGIVQDHGGDLRIEDPPGGGTRFVVSLPLNPLESA